MELPPLPSTQLVENTEAVLAVFEEMNLFDAELRAVHLATSPGGVPTLELELYLPAEYATRATAAAAEYRITLRCTDISDLVLADFAGQNVVGDYAFDAAETEAAGRAVRVYIGGTVGCDLDLLCRSVSVVSVSPVLHQDAVRP